MFCTYLCNDLKSLDGGYIQLLPDFWAIKRTQSRRTEMLGSREVTLTLTLETLETLDMA